MTHHRGQEFAHRTAEPQPPASGGHHIGPDLLVVEELRVAVRPDRSGFGLPDVVEQRRERHQLSAGQSVAHNLVEVGLDLRPEAQVELPCHPVEFPDGGQQVTEHVVDVVEVRLSDAPAGLQIGKDLSESADLLEEADGSPVRRDRQELHPAPP